MTWYDYIPFTLQVWEFHRSRLLFFGGGHASRIQCSSVNVSPPYYLWPLQPLFWRHWGYVFSGVDAARAIVWMGKNSWMEVERWFNSSKDKKMNKNISIIWIIIRRVNAPRDFIGKSRALGFDLPFVWWKNQQLSQQTPAQRSEQIWLRWHPFFLDLLQENFSDHAPNLPPKLGKTSQNFWDEIAAVCFGWTMWCLVLFFSGVQPFGVRRFRDRRYFVLGALQLLRCPQLYLGGGF